MGATAKTQYAEIIEETSKGDFQNTDGASNSLVKIEPLNFANNNDKKVPIYLTKEKMAYLVYPKDISAKDIKLLEHAINGILLRLELEKDEENVVEKNRE